MRISTVALILNSYTVAVPSLCQRVSVNLFSFTAFKNLSDSRESGQIWSVHVKACRKSLEFEIAWQTPFFFFFFYFRLSFSSNLIPSASPYVSFYFILSILQANINMVKKKKKKMEKYQIWQTRRAGCDCRCALSEPAQSLSSHQLNYWN